MFYRWRTALKRARFERLTREIMQTPPMPVVKAPWNIVSIVTENYVQMYLLSLKSFYARIKRGSVTAIIDRAMPERSREILRQHIPGIQLTILEDIDMGVCQRGGCWERLVHILDRTRDEYTMQLDCDTLAFGKDLAEVSHCVENNIPFTLGGANNSIVTMAEAAASAKKSQSNYVGIVAESYFDQYPNANELKYVRGSAGFAGFSKNGISRKAIEEFHQNMERLVGSRWREWGTEQCASNFAIANSANAFVLQRPKYANFDPKTVPENPAFLHFYGTHRFQEDYYATRAQKVIRSLLGDGPISRRQTTY